MKILTAIITRLLALMKLSCIKLTSFNRLSFKTEEIVSLRTHFELRGGGIKLGNKVCIRDNCALETHANGKIIIGNNCFFNYNCIIASHECIDIGDNTSFGPGCVIYDHDHDFRAPGGKKSKLYKSKPIVIGKNVWVGANCTILKGTVIGDNSVIAAGTVLTKSVPKNTIVLQEKMTTFRTYIPDLGE